MKYTIEGFSQEYATTLRKNIISGKKEKLIKIDCTDLVILRWFVDFFPNMKKMTVDGKEYAWLSHKKLAEDLPLLDISKRACIERMQKLVEFGILDYKLLKDGGTFSLYAFGENYINLLRSNGQGVRSNDIGGVRSNDIGGIRSNDIGYAGQTHNKDNSFIDPSTIDPSTSYKEIYKAILDFLNENAGTKFRASSTETQKHINARLSEGFTVDDFKTVIVKKCAEWIDTDMAQYLRPSTLFGTKFEGYLNAPAAQKKSNNTSGAGANKNENIFYSIGKEEGVF